MGVSGMRQRQFPGTAACALEVVLKKYTRSPLINVYARGVVAVPVVFAFNKATVEQTVIRTIVPVECRHTTLAPRQRRPRTPAMARQSAAPRRSAPQSLAACAASQRAIPSPRGRPCTQRWRPSNLAESHHVRSFSCRPLYSI